jgi:hypothetical protein
VHDRNEFDFDGLCRRLTRLIEVGGGLMSFETRSIDSVIKHARWGSNINKEKEPSQQHITPSSFLP